VVCEKLKKNQIRELRAKMVENWKFPVSTSEEHPSNFIALLERS